MDLISDIDKSICTLDLEARIAEAESLDQKNRKEILSKSESELKKLKEIADRNVNSNEDSQTDLNGVESDPSSVWTKAFEYITHAEQYYPKFSEIPNRMVQNIKRRANPS